MAINIFQAAALEKKRLEGTATTEDLQAMQEYVDANAAANADSGYVYDPTDPESWKQSITDPLGWGKGAVDSILGGGGNKTDMTGVAIAATQPSTANAQTIYERALADAQTAAALPVPQQVAGGYIAPPPSILTSAITPERISTQTDTVNTDAQAVNAAGLMQGYQAALAQAADSTAAQKRADVTLAQGVSPATVAKVNTDVTAGRIGPAAQTDRVGVESVKVDPVAQALRDEQIGAARAIASAPSAAMSQFKGAEAQVLADQLSMASAARGSERAGARREAMIQAGQQGAAAALSSAALAAKEEQDKRVAASTALSGVRTQDVGVAQTQANLDAQRTTLQANLDAAIAQGNTAAVNQIREQQAQLETEAAKASVAAGLSQQSTQAGLEQANLTARQQTQLTNVQDQNKAASDYAAALNAAANQTAQNQTAISEANAVAMTKAASDIAAAKNAANTQYATNATATNQANAALAQKQSMENANRAVGVNTTNAANTLEASKVSAANALAANTTGAQLTTDVNKTNATNALTAQTVNANNQLATTAKRADAANAALTTAINATNTQAKNAQTITDSNKSQGAADAQQNASLIGAGGSIIGAIASDERIKQDVAPVPDKELLDLAEKTRAYTFRYKPGFEDDGETVHASQMAQELERSALGKKLVHERRDGVKTIDTLGLASMMAAAAAASIRRREGRSNA